MFCGLATRDLMSEILFLQFALRGNRVSHCEPCVMNRIESWVDWIVTTLFRIIHRLRIVISAFAAINDSVCLYTEIYWCVLFSLCVAGCVQKDVFLKPELLGGQEVTCLCKTALEANGERPMSQIVYYADRVILNLFKLQIPLDSNGF